MEGIMKDDYKHPKKIWENFEDQNLGEYHNSHVSSNTLLLADAFERSCSKWIVSYELDPAYLLSALWIIMARISGMSTICLVGQYHKRYLWMASNRGPINLSSMKNSYKTMMKTVTEDLYFKFIFTIPKS